MAGDAEVSMLWEADDASAVLPARFGFTDAGHVARWCQRVMDEAWGRRLDRVERVVLSDTSLLAWLVVDGRPLVAKCGADPARFERLAAADVLVRWLAERDVPVAAPIAARDGRLRVEHGRRSIGLYPAVTGELLDATDAGQVREAGRTLAALHRAMAAYPRGLPGDAPVAAGRQLVHGDFRSANVLVAGGRVAAVLDFDEVAVRSRTADLGRAAVLLATRYHDWRPTPPETREAFVAAYDEVAPLRGSERVDLARTTSAVEAHFGWT